MMNQELFESQTQVLNKISDAIGDLAKLTVTLSDKIKEIETRLDILEKKSC